MSQRVPLPQGTSVGPSHRQRSLGRAIVFVVAGTVAAMAAIAAFIAQYLEGDRLEPQPLRVTILSWSTEVVESFPPVALLVASLLAMIAIAAGAVIAESLAAYRLMSTSTRIPRTPLHAYKQQVRADPGRVRITAVIPAHNEAAALPGTLEALRRQTRPPEHIVVVADNCTDATVAVARSYGVEVIETVDNTDRKAGALNQALDRLLGQAQPHEAVLVMDADTRLGPDYLLVAGSLLEDDAQLDAVGGVFFGEPGGGLLGQLQRNEYTRYAMQIRHRRGRVFVLTGTASVFRADVLQLVADSRGTYLPGRRGDVYDAGALTEDNEITLALKTLGCQMVSPSECSVETEVMPTWRNLWKQRQRWQRGALENLSAYGVTATTLRYWGQQIGIGYATVALWSAYLFFIILLLSMDTWIWYPFWIALTFFYIVERVATVWRAGWRGRAVAAPLVLELTYDVFLQMVFVNSMVNILLNKQASWGHVEHRRSEATP